MEILSSARESQSTWRSLSVLFSLPSFVTSALFCILFHGLDKLQRHFGLDLETHANVSLFPFPVRLITIFDCKVVMKWEGTASDGTEVKGTLTIPEVSHEIICDRLSEFVVSISRAPMLLRLAMSI